MDRESLLRKVRFPRMVVPLAVVLTSFFNLTTNLLAVLAFLLLNGITPTWGWLEVPVLIALLLVLAVGVGLLLSVAFVRARDVQPIWEVVVQMLFYGSPIFYTIDLYGELQEDHGLHAVRRDPDPDAPRADRSRRRPTAAEVAGGAIYMLIPVGDHLRTARPRHPRVPPRVAAAGRSL